MKARDEQPGSELAKLVARAGAEPGAALDTASRLEKRARAFLARVAPPGTTVTPELLASVRRALHNIIAEELVASGLSLPAAQVLALAIAGTIRITPKET